MRLCSGFFFAALALAGCGGDTTVINSPPTAAAPPTTTTTTVTTTTTGPGGPGGKPTLFQTPSGNIGCAVSAEFVNCVIVAADWTPAGDPPCPADAGRLVTFPGALPGAQCGTPDPPQGEVLDYGSEVSNGGFRCVSETDALTCSRGGHGFSLSRQAFDPY